MTTKTELCPHGIDRYAFDEYEEGMTPDGLTHCCKAPTTYIGDHTTRGEPTMTTPHQPFTDQRLLAEHLRAKHGFPATFFSRDADLNAWHAHSHEHAPGAAGPTSPGSENHSPSRERTDMTRDYAKAFLDQNDIAAETLTRDDVERFAEHHSGGLIVLGWYHEDGVRYVKMHDDWGDFDEPTVIVHEYDPGPDDGGDEDRYADADEVVTPFATGREALEHFLSVIDVTWGSKNLHTEEVTS